MTEFDADAVLDDYVARHPVARAALLDDPLFVAQMDVLRRMLALLEPALYREGLDRPAVLRVIDTLVYGTPDPDAAIERMTTREEQIAKMRWAAPSLVVDGKMAASIAAFAAFLGGGGEVVSVPAVSFTSRLTDAGRQLCASLGPLMRPTTQADRDGMLIEQHFQYADAMGIPTTLAAFRRAHEAAVSRELAWQQRRLDRLAWSGPNRFERRIGHAYRIKPKLLGIGAPLLAIDGRAYRRRQKNRVKRRRG